MRSACLKKIGGALLAALCLLGCLAGPALAVDPTAAAAQSSVRRTVRVGLPDTESQNENGGENRTVTFQKEYLQAVAEYAGWDYVYVKTSWGKCLEMMKNDEIDVLLDASKTPERLQDYDFSSESMGTEMCCLIARSNTRLNYDDYAAFNGMRVGYETGSIIVDSLRNYGKKMGFTFEAVPYESGVAMYSALAEGRIDTLVQTNYYSIPSGHVLLAKCDPAPVYIITRKSDPSLKAQLDSAMARLFSYNSSFNADIYRANFGNDASQSESFTQQELDYLKTSPVVLVPCETDWPPFESVRGGEPAGITPDIIRAIGKETGIRFRFVLSSSTQSIYDDMNGKAADTVMAVSYDYIWANAHDLLVTQPYISGSVMCVTRSPDVKPKTVAVVKGGYLENEVRGQYPSLSAVEHATFAECLKAVSDGSADCTFLNYYQANYYRSLSAYNSFTFKPVEGISQSIALGVTRESNPVLLSILSKALQRLSANDLQSILSESAVQNEDFSFRLLMRRYPLQSAFGIGIFSILLCLLVTLLLTGSTRKRHSLRLAEAKREADEANRAKSDFLSRMSHDIRTPLNGIIGMTRIAKKQQNPAETDACLDKIDTSSKFLLGLVNEVLDMSKAESGKIELHPEPYYMEDFRSYINAVIRPLCDGKNQTLSFEVHSVENTIPKLDILRTNQVYFNLLSNAVKYTPEGGRIRVTVNECITPENRDRLTVSIRDNGIGMSEEFQKVLFDPFTQERRNDNSEMRGTGLGLAIVKKIIDAMGGTISVKSKIGEGTEFLFTVECDYLAAENVGHKAASVSGTGDLQTLRDRHILLCEDHPLNQEIARALLEEKGDPVDIADNGEAGVRHFAASSVNYYDAILMDIRMPVLDGYEATRAIRALDRPDAAAVPIIAMTADAFDESIQAAREAGMNAYVTKPVEPEMLYAAVAQALSRRPDAQA